MKIDNLYITGKGVWHVLEGEDEVEEFYTTLTNNKEDVVITIFTKNKNYAKNLLCGEDVELNFIHPQTRIVEESK